MKEEPERIEMLWDNTHYMMENFQAMGFNTGTSCTPVIPLHVGGLMNAFKMWKQLDEILEALSHTKPVHRRFETVYEGRGIRIVSDYAHHPTEVAALIETAREMKPERLLAVFQPHRYSRTLALGSDFPASFEGLEHLWLVPVYAASEQPVEGGTTMDLADRFSEEWECRITCCPSLHDAWSDMRAQLRAGDLLLIIGAGNIEQLDDRAKEL